MPRSQAERSPLFPGALRVARALREAGHEALFAGGCVRDLLLGYQPKDFDIATSAAPGEVVRLFSKTVPVGERFGTIGVLDEGVLYHVTTFRAEGRYPDARHPESVRFTDAREDALRRDFTINGLFADPVRDEVFDYVGGLEDLRTGRIRAIGDPVERFSEDALRLMRAARFSVRLRFPIEPATRAAAIALAPSLLRISAERVRDELRMILTEGNPAEGIRTLDDLGLLAVVLPEVEAMKGVEQPPQFHPEGDVFIHTLLLLERIEGHDLILVLAGLLHDVGKPPTFQRADRIRFNGHDLEGARMAREILRRLAFPNATIEAVAALIEDHLYIAGLPKMREAKRRRFLAQPDFDLHLALHRADCLASHGKLDIYEFCLAEKSKLSAEDLKPKRLLTGKDLISMGYTPGPSFARILEELEDEQLEGRVRSREEAEAWVRKNFPKSS